MSEILPAKPPSRLIDGEGESKKDRFVTDWDLDKKYWLDKHKVFDWNYLMYRSILVNNDLYGKQYFQAFGLSVFIPRTFQIVESIAAQGASRKTDITVSGRNFLDNKNAEYMQAMDKAEWDRSGATQARNEAQYNALIFGNGPLFNPFVIETEKQHFLMQEPTEQEVISTQGNDPEDGIPDVVSNPFLDRKGQKWEERDIVRYKGMKPSAENPYYVFPNRFATDKKRMGHCYRYIIKEINDARDYAVKQGWCTEEESKTLIQKATAERFDKVRTMVDSLYQIPITPFTRTDNATQYQAARPSQAMDIEGDVTFFIERYEDNYYEVRCGSDINTTLHWDYSVYPHKQIPILIYQDVRVPGELLAMGEPEIIRWQQMEENKLHNYYLNNIVISMVQRYAIVGNYLEDESDASFWNPFKPIRLKQIPGININQAIMPMAQPQPQALPMQLMNLVKETTQATSGASDYVVSSNDSKADTATESNNLVAATFARINEKLRRMEEETTADVVNQWHACYYEFYDEEMDLQLTGEDGYVRFLPYTRSEKNEDAASVKEAASKLGVATGPGGAQTLEQVYIKAGYTRVVFASDLQGGLVAQTKFSDVELTKEKQMMQFQALFDLAEKANVANQNAGKPERLDSFKLAQEALSKSPLIHNIDDYITSMAPAPVPVTPPSTEAAPPSPAPVDNLAPEVPAMPA